MRPLWGFPAQPIVHSASELTSLVDRSRSIGLAVDYLLANAAASIQIGQAIARRGPMVRLIYQTRLVAA